MTENFATITAMLVVMFGVKVVPTTTRSIVMVARSPLVTEMIVTMFVMTLCVRVATRLRHTIVRIARNTSMMMTLANVVVTAVMVVAIV
jgi:hypothetical protein